jgi:8-oxo-dGTP diphosphatase
MSVKQVYSHYHRPGPATGAYKYCPFCAAELAKVEEGHGVRPACPACGFVQYRNPAPTVSIIIVDRDQVLLGRRGGEPGRGTWSLPSGYIEFDDDFLSAAIREVEEETGLRVELSSLVNVVSSFVSPRFHFLNLFLVARVLGGELAAADDLQAVDWFPLSGPFPEMGFQEDLDAIQLVAEGCAGLPLEPDHTIREADRSSV